MMQALAPTCQLGSPTKNLSRLIQFPTNFPQGSTSHRQHVLIAVLMGTTGQSLNQNKSHQQGSWCNHVNLRYHLLSVLFPEEFVNYQLK